MPSTSEVSLALHQKTIELIDKSVTYMQTVWSDEEFERVRHKCNNQHSE